MIREKLESIWSNQRNHNSTVNLIRFCEWSLVFYKEHHNDYEFFILKKVTSIKLTGKSTILSKHRFIFGQA